MIFPVSLKVFSQMLDPAGEKCDLHIRAASIFVMQLELLEIQRLVALCHNEVPTLDEESIFATSERGQKGRLRRVRSAWISFLSWILFPFAVVPETQFRARTRPARARNDCTKEFPKKDLRRIHAQFPRRSKNGLPQHLEATQFL